MQEFVRSEILGSASMFARHWDAINSLRSSLSAHLDVQLNPIHFLATTDGTRRSCSVAVWRGSQLIGLVYATQHYIRGIASGYAIGGDFSGRGSLLCSASDEAVVLGEGMRRMTSGHIHSLHLRFLPQDPSLRPIEGLKMKSFDAVIPGDLLQLQSGFEKFLGTLGKHTRRNIRACIRKVEQAKIRFAPALSRSEYERAVERLNAETDFPADPLRLARDERLMALHGEERLGLKTSDGTVISVMCGFRKAGRFHLLTQLNDFSYERLSLSLVLRSYVAQHLIGDGITSLHFMGGSSLSFGRYCQPEAYRSIFLDKQRSLTAFMKIIVASAVKLIKRLGVRVPEVLAVMCNGYLDDAMLADRTALRPAAMLSSQRQDPPNGNDPPPANPNGSASSPLLPVSASV
jgi:hypothetical protein